MCLCDKYDWWIVPDSKYYTQKVHITFILGMRSVGTYPTYSYSLVLSAHQAIHRHTVYTSFVGSFAENDRRFVFNKYEFLSIYRQTNGRYIDMTTHLDMPPLQFTSRSHDFQKVVSPKWRIFLSNFAWNTYSKSYMVQFTPWHVILGGIERSNQDHWVLIWLCIIDK